MRRKSEHDSKKLLDKVQNKKKYNVNYIKQLLKKFVKWKGWLSIFKFILKLLPIAISVFALVFSLFSFNHSKYQEKLSYEISTRNDKTQIVKFDGEDVITSQVVIQRVTGYIEKTISIIYVDGTFVTVNEKPTSSFIAEVSLTTWLQPEKTYTSINPKNLPIIYQHETIKYSYFFLLIYGMDNSASLHMITYCIDGDKVITRNYSEVEMLGRHESNSPFYEYALNDFKNLRSELREGGYLD